ncbi:MAG: hypothetical protein AAF789_06015 [Bacteroidota bacterium]
MKRDSIKTNIVRFANLGSDESRGHYISVSAHGKLSLAPSNDASSGSYWQLVDEGDSYLLFNEGSSKEKGWYLNNEEGGNATIKEKFDTSSHWGILNLGDHVNMEGHVLIQNITTGKYLSVNDRGEISLEEKVRPGSKWRIER